MRSPLPEARLQPSAFAVTFPDFLAPELANRIWLRWRSSAHLWQGAREHLVQSLDTVDNSTSLCERMLGRFSPHLTVRGGRFIQ